MNSTYIKKVNAIYIFNSSFLHPQFPLPCLFLSYCLAKPQPWYNLIFHRFAISRWSRLEKQNETTQYCWLSLVSELKQAINSARQPYAQLWKLKCHISTKYCNEIFKNICSFSYDLLIRKLVSHTTSLTVLNSVTFSLLQLPTPSLSSSLPTSDFASCSTQKAEAAGGTFPLVLCGSTTCSQHQPPYLLRSHPGMGLTSPCSQG